MTVSKFAHSFKLNALIISTSILFQCNDKKNDQTASFNSQPDLIESDSSSLLIQAPLLYANDNFEEAMEAYSVLIKRDSTNGEYYFRLGFCFAQLYRYPESVKNYLKSATLMHRQFEAYRSVGLIYAVALDDKTKALDYFNKCLEIRSDDEIQRLIKTIDSERKIVL